LRKNRILITDDTTDSKNSRLLQRNAFLQAIKRISVFERNGQRAVHKPLLTLLALARFQAGSTRLVFPEIEQQLQGLIMEFGTTGTSNTPKAHYPFWYLQTDGFWEVENAALLSPRKAKSASAEPTITSMRANRVTAGFNAETVKLLTGDVALCHEATQIILSNAFPNTLHLDVLIAVGLDGDFVLPATKRDNRFREDVMRAYSYTCVVCGYDGRIDRNPVGIEAAHIRWVNVGGPNKVSNGLCMCSLHHKLFDMGAITINANSLEIVVSKSFNGLGPPAQQLHGLSGKKIILPVAQDEHPHSAHLDWHMRQVFRLQCD
jgi:putative restriction endonuclease